jgi:SAM-dependent methyltransferase
MPATLTAYDSLAYTSGSFSFAHPGRLAAIARLFGMQPPDPRRCRVLEVGCGEGANLIPTAYRLPECELFGVDLAPTAIAVAQQQIAALNLPNVSVRCMDLSLLKRSEVGQFDIIIAHGVFSWVPDPVREALLRVSGELLTDQGVAMISYNTLPGCRTRHLVREMLAYAQRDKPYDAASVQDARAFMGSVAALGGQIESGHFSLLQRELEFAAGIPDHVLFHDDLAPFTRAFHVSEFAAMAQPHGLQYLGDADVPEMFKFDGNETVHNWLEEQSRGDWLVREQLRDFLQGRRFRKTLLCRDSVTLDRTGIEASLHRMHFTSLLAIAADQHGVDLNDGSGLKVEGPEKLQITATHPLMKHAIMLMHETAPRSWTIAELAQATGETFAEAGLARLPILESVELINDMLLSLLKAGGARVYATPTPPQRAAQPPRLDPLARLQLRSSNLLSDLYLDRMRLDGLLAKYVVEQLDGRSLADIAAHLIHMRDTAAETDPLKPELAGLSDDTIAQRLQSLVAWLAKRGLLAGAA